MMPYVTSPGVYPFADPLRPCGERIHPITPSWERYVMERNESNADRILRLIVAVVAAGIAFAVGGSGSVLGVILFVVAAIMLVTAAVGFCPLYRIFGLSTHKAVAK